MTFLGFVYNALWITVTIICMLLGGWVLGFYPRPWESRRRRRRR